MKVEVKEVEKKFEPIELVITIDSEEEKRAILEMCVFDISIPKKVSYDYRSIVKVFLNELQTALHNL